jgi:alkylhydroperoxidase/carboxymuconolactone decarboxylase family protein YurZ
MEENTRVLIGLGAAVAANCAPCFNHYHAKAKELKLTTDDIKTAVGIGGQMKTGGNLAMVKSVREIMDGDGACNQAGFDPDSAKPSCCG